MGTGIIGYQLKPEHSVDEQFWGYWMGITVCVCMVGIAVVIQAIRNLMNDYSRGREYKLLCNALPTFNHSQTAGKFASSIGEGFKLSDLFNKKRDRIIRSNLALGVINKFEIAVYDESTVTNYGGGGQYSEYRSSSIDSGTKIWVRKIGDSGSWQKIHSGRMLGFEEMINLIKEFSGKDEACPNPPFG